MIYFLFFIFFLIALVVFFGISLISWLLNKILGIKNTQSYPRNSQHDYPYSTEKQTQSSTHKKIITADEGEYIEYEEIRD